MSEVLIGGITGLVLKIYCRLMKRMQGDDHQQRNNRGGRVEDSCWKGREVWTKMVLAGAEGELDATVVGGSDSSINAL